MKDFKNLFPLFVCFAIKLFISNSFWSLRIGTHNYNTALMGNSNSLYKLSPEILLFLNIKLITSFMGDYSTAMTLIKETSKSNQSINIYAEKLRDLKVVPCRPVQ
jgi:hypothetical protein